MIRCLQISSEYVFIMASSIIVCQHTLLMLIHYFFKDRGTFGAHSKQCEFAGLNGKPGKMGS